MGIETTSTGGGAGPEATCTGPAGIAGPALYSLTIPGPVAITGGEAKTGSLLATVIIGAVGAVLTAAVGPVGATLGADAVVLNAGSEIGALALGADEIPGPEVVLTGPDEVVLKPRISIRNLFIRHILYST